MRMTDDTNNYPDQLRKLAAWFSVVDLANPLWADKSREMLEEAAAYIEELETERRVSAYERLLADPESFRPQTEEGKRRLEEMRSKPIPPRRKNYIRLDDKETGR
jgi:hypothetical protein